MSDYNLTLDEYEVANLRELLRAITDFTHPLRALANGDWPYMVRDKLEALPVTYPPNASVSEQQRLVTQFFALEARS